MSKSFALRWGFALSAFAATLAGTSVRADDAAPKTYKSFQQSAVLEPLPGLKVYQYRHEKSGLTVMLVPQPGTKVVAYVTSYNVGSRFESKGRTGLAHLFEHMMFRGTKSFPEPFKTLSEWGDQFNAYTSQDLTLYHEVVPATVFDDAAKFESQRMRDLQITPEGFKTERGAVVSERKMRTEDAPQGRLYWEMMRLAYDQHPYGTGVIGWQEDLDATTFDDAVAFYKRFYAPNRATVVIVGDVTVEKALKTLNKYYGDFKSEAFDAPKIPVEPARTDMRRRVITMKTESINIGDAVMAPTFKQADVATEAVLCTLLANSKRGFLVEELVEKGVARAVSDDCGANVDPGLSMILVTGTPGAPLAKVEKAYDAARKKFTAWLTQDRLDQAKLYYLADQWSSLRDPMNLGEQLGRMNTTAENPLFAFEFLEMAKKVSLADVKRVYADWSTKRARTRIIVQPGNVTSPISREQPAATVTAPAGKTAEPSAEQLPAKKAQK